MKFREKFVGSGKSFLKLEDGKSVYGVFRGEIYEFRQHWVEGKSSLCPGKATCKNCQEGTKPSFRFRLNFITVENGAWTAKIFEQGWTVHEQLRAIHEGDYDLEKHQVKITRHGKGTDTTYSIIPVANGLINSPQEKDISQVKLYDLRHDAPASTTQGDSEIDETVDDFPNFV